MERENVESAEGQETDATEELLHFCLDYLTSGNIPEDELYEAMEALRYRDRSAFFRFRRKDERKIISF